jgi:hypothetical protein
VIASNGIERKGARESIKKKEESKGGDRKQWKVR